MGIAVIPAPSAGGVYPQTQTFTSSGTFALPSGYGVSKPLIVDIEICGGGGGGGSGASSPNVGNPPEGGGGGGSGVTAVYRNISLTANATITIGAGGAGGASVSGTNQGNNGANGGTSDVNSLYYAPGGGGGSGGRETAATRLSGRVTTAGFLIAGGYDTSKNGIGGGGGSGGSKSGLYAVADDSNSYGGVRGTGGVIRRKDSQTSDTITSLSFTNAVHGRGIAQLPLSGGTTQLSSNTWSYNELALIQRGGGGGGGTGNSASPYQGGGGTAGTITAGGASGYIDSTSLNGSINGSNATDNGCGGGGGGGHFNSGSSGTGGNGAAGYCIIRYMA